MTFLTSFVANLLTHTYLWVGLGFGGIKHKEEGFPMGKDFFDFKPVGQTKNTGSHLTCRFKERGYFTESPL